MNRRNFSQGLAAALVVAKLSFQASDPFKPTTVDLSRIAQRADPNRRARREAINQLAMWFDNEINRKLEKSGYETHRNHPQIDPTNAHLVLRT